MMQINVITMKCLIVFVISFLQIAATKCIGQDEEKRNNLKLDLEAQSISASLDFPRSFRKVHAAKVQFFSDNVEKPLKTINLIENGKAKLKSIDKPKNALITIIFPDSSYDAYQIDDQGKLILQLSRNKFSYRIRVDALEFITELLRLHAL